MSKNLVIIPTYDEKDNIREIITLTRTLTPRFDILVVDDGSLDGTASIVKEEMEKTLDRVFLIERSEKFGLGTAYIRAFKWAIKKDYDYIFEMDADFSHNPNDLIRLHKTCEEGADMAIGSRYIKGVNVVNWPIGRILMSYFACLYVRIITSMPFMDSTSGFICYKKATLEKISLDKISCIGYAFQIEMKFNAWKHGCKVEEISIVFTDRVLGVSKMSSKIFKEAVFGVMKMKIQSFFKKYEPIG